MNLVSSCYSLALKTSLTEEKESDGLTVLLGSQICELSECVVYLTRAGRDPSQASHLKQVKAKLCDRMIVWLNLGLTLYM